MQSGEMDRHINNLIKIMENIDLHKITILTGSNGSGKSMIRKLIRQFLSKKEELHGADNFVASISMDDRAGVDSGRMMVFSRDCEWNPTSENTLDSVEGLLNTTGRFLILDEPEIGMGEELQAGLAEYINTNLDMSKNLGVLIITHSRTMVRYLKHDTFVNIEGMTEEEWINREIIPMSPDDLKKKSSELYRAFQKRLKKN